MGESSSRRCHGVGFVTGLLWSPLEQQLSSCGADGQLLSWVWTKDGLQPGRPCSRFNRQWLRPQVASAMTRPARAVAPMCGLAGSGAGLVLATARDWRVTEAAGEMDATAGAGLRINASAWDRLIHGALQLYSSWGPAAPPAANLQQLLTGRLVPALLWQGCQQAVLPAAALWDLVVAVARCGWHSLSPAQDLAAADDGAADDESALAGAGGGTSAAAAAAGLVAAAEQQRQGSQKKRSKSGADAALKGPAGGAAEAEDYGDLAGLIPAPVDIRVEVVRKMVKKQLKEAQLQAELLSQLLHALTAPFDAAVAAPPPAAAGALGYRPGVPVAAWKGLQLACYLSRCFVKLWDGPQQPAVQQLPHAAQLLAQLQQLQQRWELELLQRHVYCSLNGGLAYCLDPCSAAALAAGQQQALQHRQQQQLHLPAPAGSPSGAAAGTATLGGGGGAAAAGGGFGVGMFPVSEVLMADWVSLNIRSPNLNGDELLRPAAVVYASYSLPAPLALEGDGSSSMPAREPNPLDAAELPPVGVSGSELQAMQLARVAAEAPAGAAAAAVDVEMADADGQAAGGGSAAAPAVVSWPRCAASLLLCPAGSSARSGWGCSCCGRRFVAAPCRGIVVTPGAATLPPAAAGATQVQPGAPHCLVCGCRLSPGGAGAVGLPGGTAGVRQVVDGSPVLGVGMSLTDVVLPGV
ncbi:hypothetical protein COO60DRAFT_849018 [Scenedesmus sp. NREL 46B-D3]|nr:hypothetical protein COO60DRAFT_849018 [Scenedesmus sp. NREL 46B-D3]